MLKKDNLQFGLLVGFLCPILSLAIYYFVKFYPTFSVRDFLHYVISNANQVTAISVPCLVLNIAAFTYSINGHRDKTAKGLFVITALYAVAALLIKFF